MQTTRSRRQNRRRSSFRVTSVLVLLATLIMGYSHAFVGIIILFMALAVLELILVNCKLASAMSRLGGIPWLLWIYPVAFILVGFSLVQGSVLFSNDPAFTIGASVISAVVIALVRWYHFHYHDIAVYEALHARAIKRFTRASEEGT